MRHATRSQRLSLPSEHRGALLHNLVRSLLIHGRIRTTYARAKEAQRFADRLVTLGKEGSIHARRRAFRVLQDRTLVKRLFTDIAPSFADLSGGYTRVLRLSVRRGDGARQALLAFSRAPAAHPALFAEPKAPPRTPSAPPRPKPATAKEAEKKPKGFFEGLRALWGHKKKLQSAPHHS
ncbi:MAG: 50S ribosomal protein L17 [Candidatus Omnitrophica bacterium]|nr:50S ribosomal protein L17 [Candidatus Omnitrophota bacterium]